MLLKLCNTTIEVALVVVAKHHINTLNGCNIPGLELCITACNCDNCIGVAAMNLADNISALLVCMLRYRAAVDDRYVGRLRRLYSDISATLKLAGYGRCFGEV